MPPQVLDDIQIKALDGQFNIDEAKGIVECFVAAIGNKDSVGDIILPGAFNQSLKRRWPRVVWGHDWNQPIGKVLEIYEVGPDDPRLPMKMKANRVGGLYCKMQFNLKSERGREAFASVAFFGTDQEFSIGYKTLDADYDHSRQANLLKVVELYEVSPVLHGANQLTAAISIKDGKASIAEEVKGPQDALLDLPQERITGDVMRGYGPRRGNLERLLRYWRPIMKKPGGFRRCLVILANHPELYPLERICAWLHHETTGLWPNEGCHHPGMKNCRRKLRGVRNGSIWTDAQFNRRITRKPDDKGLDEDGDVTDEDIIFANTVLKQFMDTEPDFVKFIGDDKNWMHVGDDDDDVEVEHDWVKGDKGCGCGGCKSAEDDFEFKAGRVLSNANLAKISQAIDLLQQVVSSGARLEQKEKMLVLVDPEQMFEAKELLDPVAEYYGVEIGIDEKSGRWLSVPADSPDLVYAVKSLFHDQAVHGLEVTQ